MVVSCANYTSSTKRGGYLLLPELTCFMGLIVLFMGFKLPDRYERENDHVNPANE